MHTDSMNYCPFCGSSIDGDFEFCPECGAPLCVKGNESICRQEGVLLTNSNLLSLKYRCARNKVLKALHGIMRDAEDLGMVWYLLDLGDASKDIDTSDWEQVNELISVFIADHQLECGTDLNLLILGGDDIIPVPIIDDPYEGGGGVIPSDMCYSFNGRFLHDIVEGGNCDICVDYARNTVARIPLEEGTMHTRFEDDVCSYFRRCNECAAGITVSSVVMTSFSDWLGASTTMSQHLPLICHQDDPELVLNRMYVSPKLLTDDSCAMDIYKASLKEGDLLMFNLHGSDDPEYAGFYSVDEAFSPNLLGYTQAKVFNTVACFGARYYGYERKESMLMRALLENSFLLYTGSMVPVPMYYDYQANEARELLLNPGTGSEVFMRLYSLYQFKGMPAGEALLQAKCDYFNLCRHVESDTFSLSTILMFSLYGNPMLHLQERPDVIQSALSNGAVPASPVKSSRTAICRSRITPIYKKGLDDERPLVSLVRSAVDRNLAQIHKEIEGSLYGPLGLCSDMLDEVISFERRTPAGKLERGYCFRYHNTKAHYSADYRIEADEKGRIKRIYTTKQ